MSRTMGPENRVQSHHLSTGKMGSRAVNIVLITCRGVRYYDRCRAIVSWAGSCSSIGNQLMFKITFGLQVSIGHHIIAFAPNIYHFFFQTFAIHLNNVISDKVFTMTGNTYVLSICVVCYQSFYLERDISCLKCRALKFVFQYESGNLYQSTNKIW